ncbi:MAG: hypothetical protein K8S21_13085 [Gemmatimonadetes bacterium]|nr:hypothetical protein [Gemmatimonadota bacterium]
MAAFDVTRQRGWLIAYYATFAATLGTGALNILHVRGGFLTNHLADLVVPAWLYIASRGLHSRAPRATRIQRTVGRSPEIAAIVLFGASALTEVSQYFWPRGLFRGRFDPADIAAYAVALVACYAAERRWPVGPARLVER